MRFGSDHALPSWVRNEGSVIAPAIDTAELLDAVQRFSARQAKLAELGRRASDGTDSQLILDAAVELSGAELDADSAEIFVLDHAEQKLVRRAGWGLAKAMLGRSIGLGADLSHVSCVLATESSVVVDNFATEPRFGAGRSLMDHQVLSGVGVLIRDGVPEGVLAVHSREERHFPQSVHARNCPKSPHIGACAGGIARPDVPNCDTPSVPLPAAVVHAQR